MAARVLRGDAPVRFRLIKLERDGRVLVARFDDPPFNFLKEDLR